MLGLMQDASLLTSATLAHAARVYPRVEIVTAADGKTVHRTTYAEADRRARLLASALQKRGLAAEGVFLGALAWNTWRLFEVMHAVPGAGGVLHTANPRLHEGHLAYTVNHCGDRAVFIDPDTLPLAEAIARDCPGVAHWIILAGQEEMPETALPGVICYEDLIGEGDPAWQWPAFDERRASTICFTSATTGEPKGVLYCHRGTVLNILSIAGKNGWNLGRGDCVLCAATISPGTRCEHCEHRVFSPFCHRSRSTGRARRPSSSVAKTGSPSTTAKIIAQIDSSSVAGKSEKNSSKSA